MRAVITIVGKDAVGILAKTANVCAAHNANIVDVTQTVMGDIFSMVMLADIDKMAHALKSIEAYSAMKGGSEYGGRSYESEARGRSRRTGRYISRDGGSYGYDPYHGEPEMLERRY